MSSPNPTGTTHRQIIIEVGLFADYFFGCFRRSRPILGRIGGPAWAGQILVQTPALVGAFSPAVLPSSLAPIQPATLKISKPYGSFLWLRKA
jgi:hypothetical protein